MTVPKSPSRSARQAETDQRPLADHGLGIMILAAHGARRLALQEELIRSLTQAGEVSRLAAARAQLRLMHQAQQIRLQLLSTAQREVIDTALSTGKDLQKPVAPQDRAKVVGRAANVLLMKT